MNEKPKTTWTFSEDAAEHLCCWDGGITVPDPGSFRGFRLVAECNIEDASLLSAAPELLEALEEFLARYIRLVESGDCGNWDPETEEFVVKARIAIAKAKGTK